MSENKHLVFVYGTLRKGGGLHGSLLSGAAVFIGNGITVEKYHMTASGCPFVHPEIPTSRIVGEVYGVGPALLEDLDRIEGFRRGERENSNYYRSTIEVEMEDGKIIEADIYFNVRYADRFAIPTGDFTDYKRLEEVARRNQVLKQLRDIQTVENPEDEDNQIYMNAAVEEALEKHAKFVYVNGNKTGLFVFEGHLYNIIEDSIVYVEKAPETFTVELK